MMLPTAWPLWKERSFTLYCSCLFCCRQVNAMCAFNSETFPRCLAVADSAQLVIGEMDDIQRLHVRHVPLGEQPRRITHVVYVHIASSPCPSHT